MKKKLLLLSCVSILLSSIDAFASNEGSVGFGLKKPFTLTVDENEILTSPDFSMDVAKRKSKKRRSSGRRGKKQDFEKFLITLSGGIALPLGDFAESFNPEANMPTGMDEEMPSSDEPITNSTQIGFSFNAAFTYRFIEYFGAEVLIGGQFHSLPSYSLTSEMGPVSMNQSVEYTSWKIWNFMAGPHVFMPAGDKFTFEGRALFGLTSSTTPSSEISMSMSGIPVSEMLSPNAVIPSASATSFSYLFGLGARYNITDMIGVSFFIDYFGTTPTYEFDFGSLFGDIFEGFEEIPGFTMPSMKVEVPFSISSLNFTLGLNLRF